MWTVPIPLFYLALNGERSSTNQMLAYIGMGLCLMEIGMAIVGLRTEVERNKAAIAPDSTQR